MLSFLSIFFSFIHISQDNKVRWPKNLHSHTALIDDKLESELI